MVTIKNIKHSSTLLELDNLVDQAAAERNCQLDPSMEYSDAADWYYQEADKAGNGEASQLELADILTAAAYKLFNSEVKFS